MPKKKKHRGSRPAPPGPPRALKEYAANYRCSHCNSRVSGLSRDALGIYHLSISHDDSCPVLRGTLTDMPDAIRAATTTGRCARLREEPKGEGAE